MAGEERTVKVCGLPTDIGKEKLSDKLFIHFLRRKNGGGEVSSVSISKVNAGCALITFEDSEVAQRVVQHKKHTLLVDDRKYEITVSLSKKAVDHDDVFVCMELTMDYSLLPLGKATMSSLQQNFPDLKFKFNVDEELCTVRGCYSVVQALITSLLGVMEGYASHTTCVPAIGESASTPSYVHKKSSDGRREDHSRSSESSTKTSCSGKTHDLDVVCSAKGKQSGELEGGHHLALEGYAGLVARADAQTEELPLEDYSLVLDSDIFHYLQCHCNEEYNHILSQHKVEVVDVTTQDVTTLYLQAAEGNIGGARQRLENVHWELSQLYQEKAVRLRKEQLPKVILLISDLSGVYEALKQQLPKLMITDDETHVYLVGSSSDVSEAKQYLLDFHRTSERCRQSTLSNAKSRGQEPVDELFLPPTSTARTQYSREDQLQKITKTAGMVAGREHALASKVIEAVSETPGGDAVKLRSGYASSDRDWKDLSSPALKQMKSSGQSVGSRPAFRTGSAIGSSHFLQGPNETSQVVSSKRTHSHILTSNEMSSLRTIMPSSSLLPSKAKHFTSTQSTLHSDTFGGKGSVSAVATPPKLPSQSVLRRSNSFSSFDRSKKDEKERGTSSNIQKTQTQTNAISNSGTEKLDVYNVEVVVSVPIWVYIKEMHRTWLEDVFSSIQTKENISENCVTVRLSGTDVEELSAGQKELKKQVSIISMDFSMKEFTLNKPSVKEQKDKFLETYCLDLRKKFQKVAIVPKANSVFILGPKLFCDQVYSRMIEDFGDGTQEKKVVEDELLRVDAHSAVSPTSQTQVFIPQKQADFMKDQESFPRSHNTPQIGQVQHTNSCLADGTQGCEERQVEGENVPVSKAAANVRRNGSSQCDSGTSSDEGSRSGARKDPVLKVKLGVDGSKYRLSPSGTMSLPSFAYDTQKVAWPKEKNLNAGNHNDHSSAIHNNLKTLTVQGSDLLDSRPMVKESQSQGYTSLFCSCGERGGSVNRMACGVSLCVKCKEQYHSVCNICHGADQVRGIRGEMYFHEMSFSLPGHTKDMTLKITYKIPDGIQGEGHPKPGNPFRGGMFEAFLPLNEQSRRLRPLLVKAFAEGHTFTVSGDDEVGKVVWGSIPHKTSMELGTSKNGYPDASYLRRLTDALKSLGIEEGKETNEKNNN